MKRGLSLNLPDGACQRLQRSQANSRADFPPGQVRAGKFNTKPGLDKFKDEREDAAGGCAIFGGLAHSPVWDSSFEIL